MDKLSLKLEHYKERVASYEDTIAELRAHNTILTDELQELKQRIVAETGVPAQISTDRSKTMLGSVPNDARR